MAMPFLSRALRRDARTSRDEGLGLIEIVIAMMLLAVLAVAFLPVLIQGLQVAALNATRATANQLVNKQIETARAQADDCSLITDLASVPVSPVVDPRNVTLVTTRTVGACPSTYPGTVSFTVTVRDEEAPSGQYLSSATTYIYVANS